MNTQTSLWPLPVKSRSPRVAKGEGIPSRELPLKGDQVLTITVSSTGRALAISSGNGEAPQEWT